MKSKIIILLAALAALALTGCAGLPKKIGQLNETLKALDTLGVEQVSIPGRVTNTQYTREGDVSTLTHTNPALSGPIVIKRRRAAVVSPAP